MQQFLLQSYFLLRFLRLLPGKAAPIIAATGIFALAHLPNPILTPITIVWGAISCILFLRYRNIYALGVAHGIMGLCIAVTVPNSLHHHMRVGLGYLRYHQRVPSARPGPSTVVFPSSSSTDARVIADHRFSVVILSQRRTPVFCRCLFFFSRASQSSQPKRPQSIDRRMGDRRPSFFRRHPERSEGPLYFIVACSSSEDPANHRSQSDHRVSTDAWVIADAPTRRS